MLQGTVKFYDSNKGFGFISCETEPDHYFRMENVKEPRPPKDGDEGTFTSKPSNRNPIADNVKFIRGNTSKSTSHRTTREDGRVVCTNCQKLMVPRIKFTNHRPDYSFCPHCFEKHKTRKRTTGEKVAPWIFLAVFILFFINMATQ